MVLLCAVLGDYPSGAVAQAKCPENAHVVNVVLKGNVRTTVCACNDGYDNRGGSCVGATAPVQIDSRRIVTRDLYEAALSDCRGLVNVRQLIRQKIKQLEGWRDNTRSYQQEFEALRADAVRGVLSDALDAVPSEAIANKVTKTELAKAEFMAAFDAIQGAVAEAEGFIAQEDAERFKKIAQGELEIRRGLLEIPLVGESKQTKKWLDNLGHIYSTAIKLSAYALQWRTGKPHPPYLEIVSKTGELAGEIGGLYNPGVRVSVAATKLVVRGAQGLTAQSAVNDLSNVLAGNWNAEQHLQSRIEQLSNFIAEETRTIDSYRAIHDDALACNAP
jgi:hypothetical protein